jgi:hypothetical protein
MASREALSKRWPGAALVSCAALALATAACSGGSSTPNDGGDGGGGDAGNGLSPPVCKKQVVTKTGSTAYVINDFAVPTSDGKGISWGYSDDMVFSGYSYSYPDMVIVSDVTTGAWHLTGTVGNYSGFAVAFSCAADAAMFTGISFSIKGDAGATGRLVMNVGTSPDDVNGATAATSWGKCVPKTSQYDGTCLSPHVDVPVTTTANTVKVKWADLKGGAPQASVSPDSLSSIVWVWDWVAGATSYPVDITLDDLVFTVD